MFTFRCISNRLLIRSKLPQSCRSIVHGAASPQINNEHHQSTINVIREDLQLIHRDILQVSHSDLSLLLASFRLLFPCIDLACHGFVVVVVVAAHERGVLRIDRSRQT